jgi:hypothetical protein
MKALKLWMATHFKSSKRRHLRDLQVFSLRARLDGDGRLVLTNGKPCQRCHETLQSWQIRDIYYSGDGGEIKACGPDDYYRPTGGDRWLGRMGSQR